MQYFHMNTDTLLIYDTKMMQIKAKNETFKNATRCTTVNL